MRIALPLVKNVKCSSFYTFIEQTEIFKDKSEKLKLLCQMSDGEIDYENIIKSNKMIKSEPIIKLFSCVEEKYQQLLTDYKKCTTKHNKLKLNYDKLISKLKLAEHQEEITNVSELVELSSKLDIDIKVPLLKTIAKHNKRYYEKLSKEYNEIKKKSGASFIELFNKHNLSFTSFAKEEQEQIIKLEPDELEKILCFIEQLHIDDIDNLYELLVNTNKEILTNLMTLSKTGIVNSEFIKNNIEICYKDGLYKIFSENLRYIENETEINVLKFTNSKNALLKEPELIRENYNNALLYGLNITNKNIDNYSFLGDESLLFKMDFIIELGLENILINNPSILNYDINIFKRVFIAKLVGCPYIEDNNISDNILNKFFIDDENIDNYIPDISLYISSYELGNKEFDINKYDSTKLSYNINGVIISKNRFNRNMMTITNSENNNRIYESLIMGSILSTSDIETIKEEFSDNKIKVL